MTNPDIPSPNKTEEAEQKGVATARPWQAEALTQHSAPWIGRLDEEQYTALALGDTQAEAVANAELIVRACNSHDDLIAALRSAWAVLSLVVDAGFIPDVHTAPLVQCRDNAARALSLALGESK